MAPCELKLKRPRYNSPLFPEERSVQLTQCIIELFTPQEGSCLDPFGGALTTSVACLETGRTFVFMDSVVEAFKLSIARLRIYATPGATMQLLDEYADVELDQDSKENGESTADLSNGSSSLARSTACLLYTSPSPRDQRGSRMPSSA